MTLKPLGLIITALSVATPLYWMVPIAAKQDSLALFSQYLGVVALITMALTQIIATRFAFVEKIFGGLDRSYILHKWLGITALVTILLHDTIDADMDGLGRETVLTDIAETAGEISLYGILILIVISVATFIPYHLWFWTHKLMGTFFAMSAFHYLFILKPFSNWDPLGLYVTAFCFLGVLAYAYKLAPRWLHARWRYGVTHIDREARNTIVTLEATGKGMRHRAGQFAFVSFDQPGLTEPHPFTISKAPDDSRGLRFSMAPLGDYSSHALQSLKAGTTAWVEGPYGRFARSRSKGAEVWIAAGIGITPFVAWAQELSDTDKVTLYYCVKDEASASHVEELRQIQSRLKSFTLVLHESSRQGRLDGQSIADTIGSEFATSQVYFCGPSRMRDSLSKQFTRLGLSARQFHYEEFEIRTGIGLAALAGWILKRVANKLR